MQRKLLLFIVFFIFIGCIGCIHQEKETLLEKKIKESLVPYQREYTNISINKTERNGILIIEVWASTDASELKDFYRFYYNITSNKLVLKNYVLEDLPLDIREKAISIALENQEVAEFLEVNAIEAYPTVKRILPETSANYYAPKTLFSITWIDIKSKKIISALVDLEKEKVVNVWAKA